MIKLTRLNHKSLYVNSDLIEFIESTPDTVVTLNNDKKIVVLEDVEEVVEKITHFRRKIHVLPNCDVINREEV